MDKSIDLATFHTHNINNRPKIKECFFNRFIYLTSIGVLSQSLWHYAPRKADQSLALKKLQCSFH
jgi:hypothetical protein